MRHRLEVGDRHRQAVGALPAGDRFQERVLCSIAIVVSGRINAADLHTTLHRIAADRIKAAKLHFLTLC